MDKKTNLDFYTGNCIKTYTGLYMNVFDPKPEMICIEDIAHALSHMPRFGGHTPQFYSVAQHSTWCTFNIEEGFELEALMHDAAEAYLLDFPKPIKKDMPQYVELEDNLMKVIAEKYHLRFPFHPCIKATDRLALDDEQKRRDEGDMKSMPHTTAKHLFLELFKMYSRTKPIG